MFAILARGAYRSPTMGQPVRAMASKSRSTLPSSKGTPSSTPPASETPSSSSKPILSLDIQPTEPETDSQRTGAKSSKDSLSSIERRRRYLGRLAMGAFALAFGAQAFYMGREWEEDELKSKKLRIEDAPSTRWARTSTRFADVFDYFKEPAYTDLLPPPLPAPHGKPYTLLVSIDDLLITSTWDREHGWRTAKRPGVDYFLAYLSQFFEVVVFTTQHSYTAAPIVQKLDPYGMFIPHRLFRESTRSVGGEVVKDLSYLNRDLSKVIILDTHREHVSLHPDNAVIPPKWDGNPRDRGLVALIPFLESIGIYKPADVRPILQAYAGKDIPIEYAKREAEDKQRHLENWKGKGKKVDVTFSSLFSSSPAPAPAVPPTYLESKRKEAQALYLEEMAFIEKNKAEFDRIIKQDEEAMAAQMPSNLFEMLGAIAGGGQPGQPQGEQAPPQPNSGKEAGKV